MRTTPVGVLDFSRNAGYEKWFQGGEAFDAECRTGFLEAHHAAARRELDDWMASAEGSLALLILLDQIPRNIFRGSGHAFATDPLALSYARRALESGFDKQVEDGLRAFMYLPFEHSENIEDQRRAVALFEALGQEEGTKYAYAHLEVIRRFGRFPHRNAVLGRENTPEEQAWLDAGGGF